MVFAIPVVTFSELVLVKSRLQEVPKARFKVRNKHVEALAECFRTRVQLPPPPPTRTRTGYRFGNTEPSTLAEAFAKAKVKAEAFFFTT